MNQLPLFRRLVVESHAYCNRHCWFCGRSGPYGKVRFHEDGTPKKDLLPLGEAQRILREASGMGFHGWVALYLYDEPFFQPEHQLALAEYAKRLRMRPYVNTNTDYLSQMKPFWRRIGRAYDAITVSLYDTDDYNTALRTRAAWQRRLGRPVGLSWMGTIGDRPALEPNKHFVRKAIKGPCHVPYDKLIVAYDGASPLCCFDIGATFGLKNALQVPLKDVWYDPHRIDIMNDLSCGKRQKYALCSVCPVSDKAKPAGGALHALVGYKETRP